MLVHTIDTNVRTDNHEAVETILAMLAEYRERLDGYQSVEIAATVLGQQHVRVIIQTKNGASLLIYITQELAALGAFNEEN